MTDIIKVFNGRQVVICCLLLFMISFFLSIHPILANQNQNQSTKLKSAIELDYPLLTNSFDEEMKRLTSGKHNAVLCQYLMDHQQIKKLELTSNISVSSKEYKEALKPRITEVSAFKQKFGYAVTEGRKKLLAQLNEGLAIVAANGKTDQLHQKWFGPVLPQPAMSLQTVIKYVLYVLVPVLFIFSFVGIWYLRREIQRKTDSLRREIVERKQSGLALRQNENLLNKMGEISRIGGWEVDLKTMTPNWTEEVFKIYEVDELPPVEEGITFYPPESRPVIQAAFTNLIEKGEMYDLELQFTTAKGKRLWVRTMGTPYYDDAGNITKVIGMIQDITERKQAKEKLRQSEAELKKAQKVAHVGSWRWHIKDNDLEWSDEMYRIFNVNKKAFTGRLEDIITQRIHPDDRAKVERSNRSVVKEKKPIPVEYRVIWPDGTVRELWAEAGELVLDNAGNPAILTGIVQDITERKLIDRELQQNQLFIQRISDTIPIQLYVFSLEEGKNIYVNSKVEEFFGMSLEDLQAKGQSYFSRLIHPDDMSKLVDFNQQWKTADNQQVFEKEYRLLNAKQEYRWLRSFEQILTRNSDGVPIQIIGSAIDITESKKAEEQLISSIKEKETLLQEIHHRVKNNMQIIASLLKLQLNRKDNQDVESILKENMGRVYAMAVIHECLHQSEKLSEIDFKAYLNKLTIMLLQTYSISSRKVSIKIDSPDLRLCIGKANPLGLVLNELISNSLKYAFPDDQQGELIIKSSIQNENDLELVIEDNGIGMKQPFDWEKIDTLGLKLIKDLVEKQLNGSIELDSTRGTKFIIRFNLESDYK